ncbi:MAG: orotidine-5'-phosphate decarboxylase [Actinobacteria bacterium]|nr:orotidine-5'-phosphate decarboxylase [Actinomycetota bacterium]
MTKPPIILAIDVPDVELAAQWVKATSEYVSMIKLGLEFFIKCGSDGVRQLKEIAKCEFFLDLKLHDIPNTVGKAAQNAALLQPKFLTVHASGGRDMIGAAVMSAPDVDVTAVTILTSLTENDLREIGFSQSPLEAAVGLALLAKSAGARALVCSPHETAAIREAVGDAMVIITPGVRPISSQSDDQKRTMTPAAAIAAGANYVVIGRPITSQWSNGLDAMRRAADEIVQGLK